MNFEQAKIILIDLHLDSASFHKNDIVDKAAYLFSLFEADFVQKTNHETFYNLPYKEISVRIFESNINEIQSNTLDSFANTVKEVLVDKYKNSSNDFEHLLKCYEKFTHHIELAFIQKQFIQKASKDALDIAKKAEDLANEADAQAKSTIANYISILGIFASIIFTLFGGVNLIGSTVKLLEVNSRWPYLTFIIALLMICLLTLLNMMVKWINSMSNLKKALDNHNGGGGATGDGHWYKPWTWDFYTKSIAFFLVILLISLGGMYKVNKENLFSISTETTTKSILKAEEGAKKPATKLESEDKNKEITVVEKITLSNHLNGKSTDKEE
ncbi:hypothetical protein [Acinetobacter soli]|uniref:hypothetical protein n=1 Tax=Acinetobacter soli TaxID=487316 RepID=UPI00125E38A7|nr:hypothetical protein [Acinetobacter soli]